MDHDADLISWGRIALDHTGAIALELLRVLARVPMPPQTGIGKTAYCQPPRQREQGHAQPQPREGALRGARRRIGKGPDCFLENDHHY